MAKSSKPAEAPKPSPADDLPLAPLVRRTMVAQLVVNPDVLGNDLKVWIRRGKDKVPEEGNFYDRFYEFLQQQFGPLFPEAIVVEEGLPVGSGDDVLFVDATWNDIPSRCELIRIGRNSLEFRGVPFRVRSHLQTYKGLPLGDTRILEAALRKLMRDNPGPRDWFGRIVEVARYMRPPRPRKRVEN